MEIQLATNKPGAVISGLETRTVGRQRRFVVTRYDLTEGKSDWTITHAKTGRSVDGLLPQFLPRTIANLSAVIKAWDALDPQPDWSVIDQLSFGENARIKTHKEKAAALVFAQKLRQAAYEVYEARVVRAGRL